MCNFMISGGYKCKLKKNSEYCNKHLKYVINGDDQGIGYGRYKNKPLEWIKKNHPKYILHLQTVEIIEEKAPILYRKLFLP